MHKRVLTPFPRAGYVLMMVMVLLVVLATVLTSIANRSLQTTQEAVVAVAQLQQRIGLESCQRTLLPKAEFVFNKLDGLRRDGRGSMLPEASRMLTDAITLGGQRFDLVLFDENAKVNLNTVNQLAGQQKVLQYLRETLPVSIARSIAVHPSQAASPTPARITEPTESRRKRLGKPSDASGSGKAVETEDLSVPLLLPAFRSWGEIFDLGMLISESPDRQVQLEFAKIFTLWGSGQINIQRAADPHILMLMETVITAAEAKEILTKLREFPDVSVDTILEKELERPKERKQLEALLGTASFAYSLFVDVDTPQCRSRKLFIDALDTQGVQQISEFVFH